MKLPLYQVDAFTDHVFAGNPAAIIVLEEWLADHVMQAIAAENNLSETAFVKLAGGAHLGNDPAEIPLRWFTPELEVDLCGHATLASAHVLFENYLRVADRVVFSTKSGRLIVQKNGDLLSMDFPARPGQPADVIPALVKALGAAPLKAYRARDLMAIFETETQVRDLKPDFGLISALDDFGIIVTAPGGPGTGVDFVSRFFVPKAGIPEDPVTGSAHCTLIPYWSDRLDRKKLVARQVSARGGELQCELRGDRVLISGKAAEYLNGEISI